jgi:hypothetical protein
MIYRPVRERDPAAVRAWVAAALAATGFEEVSLLTLSPGDYSALPWLLGELMDLLAPQRVAVSLPSLRADTLTPEMVRQIQRVRRTGLTIAPEAGSDRLRRVINKNLPEEKIIASAQQAFGAGWRLLKLYFMIGLPLETPEDLAAIATLARQILKAAPPGPRPKLNLSLSTFIPKPHTPFQWEGQAPLEESRLRLHAAKDRLQARDIQIKWNSAAQSWLEGIFSRGDRRLAEVLLAAVPGDKNPVPPRRPERPGARVPGAGARSRHPGGSPGGGRPGALQPGAGPPGKKSLPASSGPRNSI